MATPAFNTPSAAKPITPRCDEHHQLEQHRAGWLGLVALAAAVALLLRGPITQWSDYHHFVDTRTWFGIANAANVLSNVPFAFVGIWGLASLARRPSPLASAAAWWLFCIALIATSMASSAYHLAPSNATLVGDRLPIAWACAALVCAFLGERVSARWAEPRTLVIAFALATLSVAWWWLTDRHGAGDLRPYLFVQFVPMLIVPLGLWLRLSTKSTPVLDATMQIRERATSLRTLATPASAWWAVLAFYASAKVFELADGLLWQWTGEALSGHTVKHLAAALAAAWLLRAMLARTNAEAKRGRAPISSGSRR